jgi:hypothetical protein
MDDKVVRIVCILKLFPEIVYSYGAAKLPPLRKIAIIVIAGRLGSLKEDSTLRNHRCENLKSYN